MFEKTAAERLRNLRSKIEAQDAHRKHVQVRGAPAQCDITSASLHVMSSTIDLTSRLEDCSLLQQCAACGVACSRARCFSRSVSKSDTQLHTTLAR